MNWILFWLFLHIFAAIVGFGPVFIFPVLARLGQSHPRHLRFALEMAELLESRYVQMIGGTMLVSGIGLIWSADINFFQTYYLIVAVVLYLSALAIGGAVLAPNTKRMLALTAAYPNGFDDPSQIPSELPALGQRNAQFGGLATVFLVVIVFLMIIQPGGIVYRV